MKKTPTAPVFQGLQAAPWAAGRRGLGLALLAGLLLALAGRPHAPGSPSQPHGRAAGSPARTLPAGGAARAAGPLRRGFASASRERF